MTSVHANLLLVALSPVYPYTGGQENAPCVPQLLNIRDIISRGSPRTLLNCGIDVLLLKKTVFIIEHFC